MKTRIYQREKIIDGASRLIAELENVQMDLERLTRDGATVPSYLAVRLQSVTFLLNDMTRRKG